MKTVIKYQEQDDMDFKEALDKAIYERRFLIFRKYKFAQNNKMNDEMEKEEENIMDE